MAMDPPAKPPSRPRRQAAEKALEEVHNIYGHGTGHVGTKRPRATSTDRSKKSRKRTHDHTPSRTFPQGDDTPAQHKQTPTKKRTANHAGLIEKEDVVYVDDMEERILAEARGITRKNIPYGEFRSTFLSRFKHKDDRPQLNIEAMKNVGIGNWEQKSFLRRLQNALPKKALGDLGLSSSFSKTLSGSQRGKEPLSQPDFFFHLGTSTAWAHVELVFEHTQSPVQKAPEKFLQWLRCAWNVFYNQPSRHYLYGILFLQPYALITYVDHGCAGYSEPLDFVKNPQHTQFLADFVADFIAEPEHRGRDPTVTVDRKARFIEHAGMKWAEASDGLLCYRPCVFGRHIRVARVHPVDSPEEKWVMKNAWEEKLENPSPPPEEEVLRILDEANVRGLPQLHESCRSTAEGSDNVEASSDNVQVSSDNAEVSSDNVEVSSDDNVEMSSDDNVEMSSDNMEVLTSKFPLNCENALAAVTNRAMKVAESSFVSNRTSKSNPSGVPAGITGKELVRRVRAQKKDFNECTEVRRRRTRLIVSYCQPLKEAMRNAHPKELMRTIRDAMVVYYEAYKRPEHGFLHGDISIENIMVPVEDTILTGGLTYETRRGTLIDWNLCFTADGTASSRNIRSGTTAFLAPSLLEDEPIARRTLGHDMESFFAVMLWIASLNYDDDIAFRNKPLVRLVIGDKLSTEAIANIKMHWFENPAVFKKSITDHFEQPYREDDDFVNCIWDLLFILYKHNYDKQNYDANAFRPGGKPKETNDDDPMKERVFKDCMAAFDKRLGDEGKQSGSYQLDKIDAGEDPEESEDEFDDRSLGDLDD